AVHRSSHRQRAACGYAATALSGVGFATLATLCGASDRARVDRSADVAPGALGRTPDVRHAASRELTTRSLGFASGTSDVRRATSCHKTTAATQFGSRAPDVQRAARRGHATATT